MNVPFVDLHAQHLTIKPEIDSAIATVIRDPQFIRGPHVDEFETALAEKEGMKHCISCANDTDALCTAMRGLGIKPGGKEITTAHSWISTTETITQPGGKVVFCEKDLSFTIDAEQIEAKITSRTVGIIPVHLYGQPADMRAIMEIAREPGLWVIEECAQAHLATFFGQQVGTFGNAATYSFYPGKNLGAYGDAGGTVMPGTTLARWCETFGRHAGKGDHVMEGINSRLDGMQAAIVNVKLRYLSKWTAARQRVAAKYNKLLDVRKLPCPPSWKVALTYITCTLFGPIDVTPFANFSESAEFLPC